MSERNPHPADIEQLVARGVKSGVAWPNLYMPVWNAVTDYFQKFNALGTFALLGHVHNTAAHIDLIEHASRYNAAHTITGTAATVPQNTTRRTDGTKFLLLSNELYYLAAGAADVLYSLNIQVTSAVSETVVDAWLEHYNGSTWAEVLETRQSARLANTASARARLAYDLRGYTVALGNGFRIRAQITSGTSTIATFTNRASLQSVLYHS